MVGLLPAPVFCPLTLVLITFYQRYPVCAWTNLRSFLITRRTAVRLCCGCHTADVFPLINLHFARRHTLRFFTFLRSCHMSYNTHHGLLLPNLVIIVYRPSSTVRAALGRSCHVGPTFHIYILVPHYLPRTDTGRTLPLAGYSVLPHCSPPYPANFDYLPRTTRLLDIPVCSACLFFCCLLIGYRYRWLIYLRAHMVYYRNAPRIYPSLGLTAGTLFFPTIPRWILHPQRNLPTTFPRLNLQLLPCCSLGPGYLPLFTCIQYLQPCLAFAFGQPPAISPCPATPPSPCVLHYYLYLPGSSPYAFPTDTFPPTFTTCG